MDFLLYLNVFDFFVHRSADVFDVFDFFARGPPFGTPWRRQAHFRPHVRGDPRRP